jgi:hypothetical protein
MKPYGRDKKIIGGHGEWKVDYHIHHKGRKILNWWEDRTDPLTRSRQKQLINKEIQYAT